LRTIAAVNPIKAKNPPSSNPITSSRRITRTQSVSLTSPRARAVMTSVADWVPVLPPAEITSGMNMTNQAYFWVSCS
jgi:hypothetical protein